MNVRSVEADNGSCIITTDTGVYDRWPGRTHQGRPWWAYTANDEHGLPLLVTVPATVDELEAIFQKQPRPPHLHLVWSAT